MRLFTVEFVSNALLLSLISPWRLSLCAGVCVYVFNDMIFKAYTL